MIRLVVYLVIITALAFGGAWLAERPGQVLLDWQGYQVETSILTAMLGLLLFAFVVILAWMLFRVVTRTPDILGRIMRERRRDKGYKALSQGMIAVGVGDAKLAGKFSKDANKWIGNEPLTALLKAQSAQLSGDRMTALAEFKKMLDKPETRLLGLRGLFTEAKRAKDFTAARYCAEEAMKLAPRIPWAGTALFEIDCANRSYESAIKTLTVLSETKNIDKGAFRRKRAVLLTALAMEKEDQAPEKALSLATEANTLDVSLVETAVIAGRLHARAGNYQKGAKLLEKTWRKNPHPEIATAYAYLRSGDSPSDRYKRVKSLAQKLPKNRESMLALAGASIDAQEWDVAKETLGSLVKTGPSQRVCELMAEYFDRQGDKGQAREWLSRAVHAPRDPVWMADGRILARWTPVSPTTGQLDVCEWTVPAETLGGPEKTIALDDFTMPEPVPEPAPPATPQVTAAVKKEDIEDAIVADETPAQAQKSVEPAKSTANAAVSAEPLKRSDDKGLAQKASGDTSAPSKELKPAAKSDKVAGKSADAKTSESKPAENDTSAPAKQSAVSEKASSKKAATPVKTTSAKTATAEGSSPEKDMKEPASTTEAAPAAEKTEPSKKKEQEGYFARKRGFMPNMVKSDEGEAELATRPDDPGPKKEAVQRSWMGQPLNNGGPR